MIFPKLECDSVVQVADKFRIDATKSYIAKGEAAITLVEIEPEAGAGFIAVQGAPVNPKNWTLDWEYQTAGDKVITLQITTDGLPTVLTKTVTALTEADDKLFSTDQDLVALEHNITKYVPEGRSTFKYLHREAQKQILEWLYINGYRLNTNERLTKEHVLDIEEVRFWSKFKVLSLLYRDLSTTPNDVHDVKSREYQNKEHVWRQSVGMKFDFNGDGELGNFEQANFTTRELIRS